MKSLTLVYIQTIICVIILLAVYIVKSFSGDIYLNIKNWYYENLNYSIVMTVNAPVCSENEV